MHEIEHAHTYANKYQYPPCPPKIKRIQHVFPSHSTLTSTIVFLMQCSATLSGWVYAKNPSHTYVTNPHTQHPRGLGQPLLLITFEILSPQRSNVATVRKSACTVSACQTTHHLCWFLRLSETNLFLITVPYLENNKSCHAHFVGSFGLAHP